MYDDYNWKLMGKKKQEKKTAALPERKSILDSLKFMQVSKDAVVDKKHKHKHREEGAIDG